MLREKAAGTYRVSTYFLARTICDLSIQVMSPILYSIIVYFMIGYKGNFGIFLAMLTLDTIAATSLAVLISCVCVSIELTTVVMSCCFELMRLYGNFFMKPYEFRSQEDLRFIESLSYLKYVYITIARNELEGLVYTCSVSQAKNGVCPIQNGDQTSVSMGYNVYPYGHTVGTLICIIVLYRVGAYIALRVIKN